MKPVSPVIPNESHDEIIVAETQDEYQNLPSIALPDGMLITRWELSDEEIAVITQTKSIYALVYGKPVRPMMLQVEKPLLVTAPVPEITSICAVRFTEERLANAQRLGIETVQGNCSECSAEVLLSTVSAAAMAAQKIDMIICLECADASNAPRCVLPETREQLKEVIERARNN